MYTEILISNENGKPISMPRFGMRPTHRHVLNVMAAQELQNHGDPKEKIKSYIVVAHVS